MHTLRHPSVRLSRSLGLALTVALVPILAGCTSSGTIPTASPSSSPEASQPPTGVAPGAPAASDPNGSVGSDLPTGGGPGVVDPAGRIVTPKPGQLDVHPISAQQFSSTVDGRRVAITVHFASGVEPCSVLDSIVVSRKPGSFAITLREGRGPGDAICEMIAEFKRAIVDLGELAPGSYTVTDTTGGAAPITVTVS